MRITQGYVSKSLHDFAYLRTCGLTPYHDRNKPAIFFGCYREEDVQNIIDHKGLAVVHWMGQDATECIFYGWYNRLRNAHHVGFHKNIIRALQPFVNIRVTRPWTTYPEKFYHSPIGKSVYAYVTRGHPYYHNEKLVNQIKDEMPGINFIISNGDIPQDQWINENANRVYDKCCCALVLNEFAGGANTIMQFGLKGRPVITNALELPNTVTWQTKEDIKVAITQAREQVGKSGEKLATEVRNFLNNNHNFLNLSFYGVQGV